MHIHTSLQNFIIFTQGVPILPTISFILIVKNQWDNTLLVREYNQSCGRILFISLKPKYVQIIFNNSARTAKKTQHFTIINMTLLMLLKEIISAYNENQKYL